MKTFKWRKSLLIYPRFQLILIAGNALATVAAMFFVVLQLRRALNQLSQLGVNAHLPANHAFFKFIRFEAHELYLYIAIAAGAGLVASALFTLLVSHRLAGPIVRLKSYFATIRKAPPGERPEPLQFRSNDYLADLPELVNGAVTNLQEGTNARDRRLRVVDTAEDEEKKAS